MNYYPHHISDFNNATRHLTRIERSIYRDLIEHYYDSEAPIENDIAKISRKIIAVTPEEKSAIETILEEYFSLIDGFWFHARCDEELAKYRDKSEKAVRAGKASAAKRTFSPNPTVDEQTLNGRSTDDELTNNQEPITNNQKKTTQRKSSHPEKPDGVSQEVWIDFIQIRKTKRSPLTQTALNGIANQASKAGLTLQEALEICCARGWQGFNAEWVANQKGSAKKDAEPQWAKEKRQRMDEFLGRSSSTTIEAEVIEIKQGALQ